MNEYVLNMKRINKEFPGVKALSDVNFSLKKGEIHGIVGENGAGKSTLVKCLGGIVKPDSGQIEINGESINIYNVRQALSLGIAVISQELNLSEQLSVADNIFMGREHVNKFGFINGKKTYSEAQRQLELVGGGINANELVGKLSTAKKQMVEIAKALSIDAKILVMDEPTAMLTNQEAEKLFEIALQLKNKGISIIYISHRLFEVFKITDRITVLRDGNTICTLDTNKATYKEVVRLMVGRKLEDYYKKSIHIISDKIFEVKNITHIDNKVKKASFFLCKGEILGFAGLVGAGRSELMRMIFGIDKIKEGEIIFKGESIKISCSLDAIRHGIGLVSENRKEEGLFLYKDVAFNLTIGVLDKFIHGFKVNEKKENEIIEKYINALSIKAASKMQFVMNLSGGNQQKVILAKWLAINPELLILDEPTRGIDVGAKADIYAIMDELVKKGISIIMVSSEMAELINICNRIYIMHEGEINACLEGKKITQEEILEYAIGAKNGIN